MIPEGTELAEHNSPHAASIQVLVGRVRVTGEDEPVLSAGEPPRRLYVVFDVAGIEAASSEDFWWFSGLASVVILLTLVAIGLGTVLSRRVVEPVTRLADVVGVPRRNGRTSRGGGGEPRDEQHQALDSHGTVLPDNAAAEPKVVPAEMSPPASLRNRPVLL